MKLGSKHKVDPSFNMSSMTDVIFLLLVFFMLTSNVVTTGKRADTPRSNEPILNSQSIKVEVDPEGRIWVDDKNISLTSLEALLIDEISKLEGTELDNNIVIHGDKDSNYGVVIEVYNVASQVPNSSAILAFKQLND